MDIVIKVIGYVRTPKTCTRSFARNLQRQPMGSAAAGVYKEG